MLPVKCHTWGENYASSKHDFFLRNGQYQVRHLFEAFGQSFGQRSLKKTFVRTVLLDISFNVQDLVKLWYIYVNLPVDAHITLAFVKKQT